MVIEFSDEVIDTIAATLPLDTDPARLALLPELLRAWANEDLPEHLSWDSRAEARQRQKRLRAIGAKAQQFIDGYNELASDWRALSAIAIEPQMLRDGASLRKTDFLGAMRRRDEAIKWLVNLACIFNTGNGKFNTGNGKTQKRQPYKKVKYYLIVRDLVAIYTLITKQRATRKIDWDSGQPCGPFSDFVEKIWMEVFENKRGFSYAIRVWADEMTCQQNAIKAEIEKVASELSRPLDDEEREDIASGIRENSTFAANLGLRHPELWRKLSETAR
jgi:hypothetical protein